MSIRMGIAIVAGLGAAFALAGTAGAEMAAPATKAAKPKTVTITGCATKGVPDFCIKMGNYNVTGANPAVPVGKKVRLKGTVSTNPSICFGTTLTNIQWMAVKGKCPAPKGTK